MTGRFASGSRFWVAAAALILLIGAACTDQPEATEQGASPLANADPGAKVNSPPSQVQARASLKAPAEPAARARAQDPERREQRIADLRKDRYSALGLSDEQKQRIEALRAEQRAWRAEHGEEVRALGDKRRAARQAGDEAEGEAIRLKLLELRESLPTERDIVALLTAEQRAELRKNRRIMMRERASQRRAAPAQDAAEAAPAPS